MANDCNDLGELSERFSKLDEMEMAGIRKSPVIETSHVEEVRQKDATESQCQAHFGNCAAEVPLGKVDLPSKKHV